MEAALFAVPMPHVRHMSDQGSRQGAILLKFKEEIGRPISAILILNTISNTLGAALAGALVGRMYGQEAVVLFSIVFTLLILFFSEIIPKQIGAVYARQVSPYIAYPLLFLIRAFLPLVKLTEGVSQYVQRKGTSQPSMSTSEVISMADLGREEGVLDHLEGSVIKNIVGLDRLLVKDVLTPRVVVFRMLAPTKLEEIRESIMEWNHTRVPIYSEDAPDSVTRYVIQRDIFRALLIGQDDKTLEQLSRPLTTVSEFMRADKLLLQMFEQRESMSSVVDEHGGFAGIVTLEDIIEEIVGREIVDEYDLVSDLRSYAQILHNKTRKGDS